MGLSIHYSGCITDKSKLSQLIEEVEEIATVHGWRYCIYERSFPKNDNISNANFDGDLYGIDISPKGSEPISFCFLSNGKMTSVMQLVCWGKYDNQKQFEIQTNTQDEYGQWKSKNEILTITKDNAVRYLYECSSKTQYAGAAAHEMIIGLIRYVSKKYLSDFKLTDETLFWETGDVQLLEENFKRSDSLISEFGTTLSETFRNKDESVDEFIVRILKNFRDKKGV